MSESFNKNVQAAPKINPDAVLKRIHVLRGTFSGMGRNNDEFPILQALETAFLNGTIKAEAVMEKLDSMELAKARGDYN